MNTVRIVDFAAPAAAPAVVPAPAAVVAAPRRRPSADNDSRFDRRGPEPWFAAPSVAHRALFGLLAMFACGAMFAGVLALFVQAGA